MILIDIRFAQIVRFINGSASRVFRFRSLIARCRWIFMFHLSLRTINKSNVTSTRNKRLKRDNDRRTDYTQTAEITVIVVYAHNRLWINISSMIKYMYIISRYVHDFIREKNLLFVLLKILLKSFVSMWSGLLNHTRFFLFAFGNVFAFLQERNLFFGGKNKRGIFYYARGA